MSTEKLIKLYLDERSAYRKVVNEIALYSNGSYTVSDMWQMPWEFVKEITETIVDKQKKEQEAMQQRDGKTRKTF